jgi:hypothetical protein
MPEQPQWSERTLDMPPQDPWAEAPTAPTPAAPSSAPSSGAPYPGGQPTPGNHPFSTGRAQVNPHPRTQQFAADHEPTGTGWPGADLPAPRHTVRDLRRGGEWSTAALLFAFVCWGIWAISSGGDLSTPIIVFLLSVVVAAGLFTLSRWVGRIVLEKQFHRVRRSARGSHLVAAVFLVGVGLAHLQQTEWVMSAFRWVVDQFGN